MSQAISTSVKYSSYWLRASVRMNHTFPDNSILEIGTDIFDGHSMGHEIVALALDTLIYESEYHKLFKNIEVI